MSSGRLGKDGEPIINEKNLTKETKIYREFKNKKNWSTFEQYSDYVSRFWQISFLEKEDQWILSTCTCSKFKKDYICKHLLLQAIRFEYVTVPLTAQTVEFETALKRGRPAAISKALQIDTIKSSKRSASVQSILKPKVKKLKKK